MSNTIQTVNSTPKLEFVTIESTVHSGKEKWLLETARLQNVNIKMLGKGLDWKGNTTKLLLLKKYLQTSTAELVCYVDARDVLFAATEQQIYDTFVKNFSMDTIVFNGETNCHPDKSHAKLHPHQDKKYKYLNAGCVIGSRTTLLAVVKDCIKLFEKNPSIKSDQYFFQKIFLSNKYKHRFTLDYDCVIFQCIWDQDWGRNNNFDLVYTRRGIYNRLTKTNPLIFHYPGPTCVGSQAYKVITKKYHTPFQMDFFTN